MIAIAMVLAFVSYTLEYYGVALLKGWNITILQMISPVNYYGADGTNQKWPPPKAGNTEIIPTGAASGAVDATLTATTTLTTTGTGSGGGGAGPAPTGISNAKSVSLAASKYGWGKGSEWSALMNLISRESGGNPKATNPSSGAFGIAQALGHGTAGSAGCGRNEYGGFGLTDKQASQANCGNAYYQSIWMMNYIKKTYGSPSAAWSQYCKHPNGACYY